MDCTAQNARQTKIIIFRKLHNSLSRFLTPPYTPRDAPVGCVSHFSGL
ncbi:MULTISPECIES: hypothetical protein [Alistipes]